MDTDGMTPSELATMAKYFDDNAFSDAVIQFAGDASGIVTAIPGIPVIRANVRRRLYRALLRMGGLQYISETVDIPETAGWFLIADLSGIAAGDPYEDVFAAVSLDQQSAIIKKSCSHNIRITWAGEVGEDRARQLLAVVPDTWKDEWEKAMVDAGYQPRKPSPPPEPLSTEGDPNNPTRTSDKGKGRAREVESKDSDEDGDDEEDATGMDESDGEQEKPGPSLQVKLGVHQPLKGVKYDFGDEDELLKREFQTAEEQVALEKAKRVGLADYFRLYPCDTAARDIRSNRLVTYGVIPAWAAKMRAQGKHCQDFRIYGLTIEW